MCFVEDEFASSFLEIKDEILPILVASEVKKRQRERIRGGIEKRALRRRWNNSWFRRCHLSEVD
jgi:hypothetical protein